MTAARSGGPHYRVEPADPSAHLVTVTLTVPEPEAAQRVSLPAWIPGSYLLREFARHLQKLTARQDGKPVAVQQLDKASWQVDCVPSSPLVLSYEVYAFDNSVRTAWLDSQRGFFNGTSLCLKVHGQEKSVHELELVAPKSHPGWEVATGLEPVKVGKRGFGTYCAADYDELVDCPVELGAFHSAEFRAGGVPHRVVIAGATEAFDSARLLADMQKICEAQIRFWHDRRRPPFKHYLFLLNAVHDGYGGLEHRNSTALIASRSDLPRLGDSRLTDGYVTLLGLISHEYFHTWNVKRLRPAEFAHYDYTRENYSQLLWFFEGFTSYYDDLLLRRAGLVDEATYVRLLNKTVNQVLQTPGREVQSVAQASFDAWVKYYRQDENTPNATVSYYTKGALVALCLDLTLRDEGQGSLDEVMRELWRRCDGGPLRESEVRAALRRVGGRAYGAELADWVHGTGGLPAERLLKARGAKVQHDAAPLAQRLGLRVGEAGGALHIKTVLRGGAAEAAGFAAGDEWLGVEFAPARRGAPAEAWRVARLDEVDALRGARPRLTALVSRDRQILRLALHWPEEQQALRLGVDDAARLAAWLNA